MKEENINIDKEINDLIPKEDNEIKIINDDIIEDDEIIKEEEKEDEKDKDNEKEIKEEKEKSVDSGLDLTDDQNFERLKEELDKANNFIDYFLVVGLPPKIFMEKWLYNSDVDYLNEKFKDNFQPKVISSFPNYEKHTIAFDDSVISHCFPNGFKAIISSEQPKTKVFSFILDNNYFNLNFPQKYLTCLICYENILKYKKLYDAYKQYKKEDKKENEIKEIFDKINNNINNEFDESKENNEINSNIYIPKCLMVMSLYPYFAEFEKILTEIYKYSLIIEQEKNVIKEDEVKLQKDEVQNFEIIDMNQLEGKQEKKEFNIDNNKIIVPMDKIIENLLIELPVPPRGIFKVKYTLINQERELKQNLMNQLPIVDINLKRLFTFDVKEIVKMYHNLFLETRILFFSENIQLLNMYIFGLLSLLYPFQYQYQVVTILPEENFEIIESITPFIAGINMPYRDDFFEIRDLTLSDAILIVDIDNTQTAFVNKQNDIPEFPKGYRKTLEKNLQSIKTKYFKDLNNSKSSKHKNIKPRKSNQSIILNKNSAVIPENVLSTISMKNESHVNKSKTLFPDKQNELDSIQEIDDDENDDLYNPYGNFNIDFEFNKEVNELFFNFNANLLSGYNKFLDTSFYSTNTAPCLEVLFKVNEFLKDVSSSDRAFYEKFISETQIFGDFLYLRMIPKNTKEKIQILAFDEKINENSASVFYKPPPSVFINSKEYDFVNVYKVQKPRQLTKEEIEFYRKKENKIKLLNYGIIVKEKNNEIQFEYPTFPILTTKYFFKNNIQEYFVQNELNENVESINTDIVSKSHLGGVAMRLNDMDNYIYLCWMQMWAITFWYCDEKEKRYRFQELLKVISKTSSHEMEIFNLLFEALSLYGEDYMVLKLYDILLTLHLNPSFKVHNIVMKLLDKKKFEGDIKDNLQKSFKNELKNVYDNKDFRKRTFKSKYYGNILTDDIIFFAFDSCLTCQKDIDLESISMNFKAMNRELTWITCPECDNSILPKLTIQFGKEINKNGKMKQNSCKLENIVLFSPFFLKNNYNSAALRTCGVKMDVEDLMLKFNNIFWNSLWYFKLKHLEYDFMLPYEEGLNKEIDDYLDISIGDDENKNDNNNNENKIEIKNEEKVINKFDLSMLKIEKNEIILKS